MDIDDFMTFFIFLLDLYVINLLFLLYVALTNEIFFFHNFFISSWGLNISLNLILVSLRLELGLCYPIVQHGLIFLDSMNMTPASGT